MANCCCPCFSCCCSVYATICLAMV